MSIYYFSKNSFVMKHSGENEIPNFVVENPTFFSRKSDFFPKTYKIRGFVLVHILLFESGFWSLSEFPCFIVYAARNIPSISDAIWCKPGFILVRRSTQTELRKRIYTDTRVMAFILLRRYRRVCRQTYAIAVCVSFHGDGYILYVA